MSTVPMSGSDIIDGILWGVRWDAASLTYGFATQTSQYFGYQAGSISGFEAFNATQRAAATSAVEQVAAFTNLNITFTSDPSQANLRFAEASAVTQFIDPITLQPSPGTIPTAVGTPPDDFSFPNFAHGDMFFNRTDYNSPVKGNFAYATVIHELGHALGLKHGHIVQPSPDKSFNIPALPADFDSMEYSIMTYRSNAGGPSDFYRNEDFGYAQSWMMFDIAALQYLYGADYTANGGNTTYTWNANTGEMSIDGVRQGTPGANRVFLTVWDGNGTDTYNMSNYANGVTIDLTPGSYSITSEEQLALLNMDDNVFARGNVFNALVFNNDLRSLIENAVGGGGNDIIGGNVVANVLTGNVGSDRLWGFEGADTLRGGSGRDSLFGGSQSDSLDGGEGKDRLDGGKGNDSFVYGSRKDGGDKITGYSSVKGNNDHFEFNGKVFGRLSDGELDDNRFQSSNSSSAQSSAIRFFFEEDTGILRFDSDGDGGNAAIVIAHLKGVAQLFTDDIVIF